ncbi:hypothetical protein CIK05_05530 [Bdellovibrio sp. qaytius]|nr:hypothetical protein CIK05_05530 [Bdellovibrio sp. qaytius]
MKTLALALLVLIINSTAFAANNLSSDPTQFCNGNSCSEPMLAIIEDYKQGSAQFAQADLSAYSGKCFHLNSMYDPNYAHVGAFVFEKSAPLHIMGIFGFFYESDPYAGLTPEETKSELILRGSKGAEGILEPDHAELAYVGENSELRYWFRNSADQNSMLVIGRQADGNGGMSSLLFCHMLKH